LTHGKQGCGQNENRESHRRFDTRQDVSRLYPLGGSHFSPEVLWDEPQTASARSSAVERLVLNFFILVETLLKCQRMSRNRRRRQILTCSEQECGQDETEKAADASRHNRMFHSSILRKLEASRYRHTMCETKDCNTLERWGFRLGSLGRLCSQIESSLSKRVACVGSARPAVTKQSRLKRAMRT